MTLNIERYRCAPNIHIHMVIYFFIINNIYKVLSHSLSTSTRHTVSAKQIDLLLAIYHMWLSEMNHMHACHTCNKNRYHYTYNRTFISGLDIIQVVVPYPVTILNKLMLVVLDKKKT